ncbi:hypothetical protein E2C01_062105 [Portunus trituberculatus]|uniref:Uncharacterized protein n=1 Tax=Portunus trituberculatus TaxID=210409 RepID=A0A5B7HDN2_PORTR|nr:hypothetical protein [Portunus trituberculatus]
MEGPGGGGVRGASRSTPPVERTAYLGHGAAGRDRRALSLLQSGERGRAGRGEGSASGPTLCGILTSCAPLVAARLPGVEAPGHGQRGSSVTSVTALRLCGVPGGGAGRAWCFLGQRATPTATRPCTTTAWPVGGGGCRRQVVSSLLGDLFWQFGREHPHPLPVRGEMGRPGRAAAPRTHTSSTVPKPLQMLSSCAWTTSEQ